MVLLLFTLSLLFTTVIYSSPFDVYVGLQQLDVMKDKYVDDFNNDKRMVYYRLPILFSSNSLDVEPIRYSVGLNYNKNKWLNPGIFINHYEYYFTDSKFIDSMVFVERLVDSTITTLPNYYYLMKSHVLRQQNALTALTFGFNNTSNIFNFRQKSEDCYVRFGVMIKVAGTLYHVKKTNGFYDVQLFYYPTLMGYKDGPDSVMTYVNDVLVKERIEKDYFFKLFLSTSAFVSIDFGNCYLRGELIFERKRLVDSPGLGLSFGYLFKRK
jgi:hypothetical protein